MSSICLTCSVDLASRRKPQISWVTTRFRWKMCRRSDVASTTTHFVLSRKLSPLVLQSQTRFIVLACLGFWNTRVIRDSGTYQKSKPLRHSLARLGPGGSLYFGSKYRKQVLFSGWECGRRDLHRIARRCAGTGGLCCVSGQKHVHPKISATR